MTQTSQDAHLCLKTSPVTAGEDAKVKYDFFVDRIEKKMEIDNWVNPQNYK